MQAIFLPVPAVGILFFLFFYAFVSIVYWMETFYFFFCPIPPLYYLPYCNEWSHQNLRWVHFLSFLNVHSRSKCTIIDHPIRCTLLSSTTEFCSSSTFISRRRRDSTFTCCCSENVVFLLLRRQDVYWSNSSAWNIPTWKFFFWSFKTRSRSSERSRSLFKCFKGLQMIPGIPVYCG